MKRVLFVCVHNSGRSQMAAALMERLANGAVAVDSAGTMPSDAVNPVVVEAMKEKVYAIDTDKVVEFFKAGDNRGIVNMVTEAVAA